MTGSDEQAGVDDVDDVDDAAVTRGQLLAWLSASCARQGVSVVITDPGVIAQAAILLAGNCTSKPARQRDVALDAPRTATTQTSHPSTAQPETFQPETFQLPTFEPPGGPDTTRPVWAGPRCLIRHPRGAVSVR